MRRSATVFAALSLALIGGCGGDDDGGQSGSTDAAEATTEAPALAPDPPGPLSAADGREIEDVIKTWLTEGGCRYMTDGFLEAQTFIDEPGEACDQFEKLFEEPSFSRDDIIVSDIKGTPMRASAVISDDFSNVKSTYRLVAEGGGWKIDSTDIG